MNPQYERRISNIQQELVSNGIDLMVFCDRENLIYYTGLTEIECMALIIPAAGEPISVTLWLDVPYMKKYSAVPDVRGYYFPENNLGKKIVEVIKDMGYNTPKIGFSKYFVEFSTYEALRNGLPEAEYINGTAISYKVRAIKDSEEIEFIKKASIIVSEGMRAAVDAIKPGMTEVEVLGEAEYAMRKSGSEGATFRMQVLTASRQLLTHPYASNTVIENNQTVVIHLGAAYKGYTSKMCRTVALGNDVNPESKIIYKIMVDAQQAAVEASKDGVSVKDVYNAAFKIIDFAGYRSFFIDDIGHGVGIRQSEFYPIIGRTRDFILKENMVIDLMFPTIYKKDVGGARVTDTILITNESPEILTNFTYDMVEK